MQPGFDSREVTRPLSAVLRLASAMLGCSARRARGQLAAGACAPEPVWDRCGAEAPRGGELCAAALQAASPTSRVAGYFVMFTAPRREQDRCCAPAACPRGPGARHLSQACDTCDYDALAASRSRQKFLDQSSAKVYYTKSETGTELARHSSENTL